jgi:hypothetical protein
VNLPIGAIVRIEGDTGLAVVVPNTWGAQLSGEMEARPVLAPARRQ